MQRLLFILLMLFSGITLAQAHDTPAISGIDVYEFGTYTAVGPSYEQPASHQGIRMEAHESYFHVETTRTIVARVGVRFGFRYRTKGTTLAATAPITMVWKFPSPGITGADPHKIIKQEVVEVPVLPNESYALTMSLDSAADLVPGIWTFEIWSGKNKLAEEKFELIMPLIS